MTNAILIVKQSLLCHLPHILTGRKQPDDEGTTKNTLQNDQTIIHVHTLTYVLLLQCLRQERERARACLPFMGPVNETRSFVDRRSSYNQLQQQNGTIA